MGKIDQTKAGGGKAGAVTSTAPVMHAKRFMHIGSLLQQLFDNISSAIAIYEVVDDGRDFFFVDVNRSLEKIEKVSKKDLIGKSVLQVFPAVKQFGLFRVFQKVWKTGKPQHHPISMYKDDRIVGWRDNYVYKLSTGEIAAVYDDVTERKMQEELLGESENKYRTLYETMAQGVIYQDASGEVISMNPAAQRILGVDLPSISHLEQIDNNIRAVREDGTPFAAAEHPTMVTLKTSQPVHDAVMGIYNPLEKGYRWLIVNSVPLFRPGEAKPYQVFVTFDDITSIRRYEEALRERESEFRTLSENSAGIVARFDRDLRYTYINPAIERFTGIKPAYFIGKNFKELDIPHEQKLLWKSKLQQVFRTGKALSFELSIRNGENEYHLFNTVTPEFAEDGSVKSALSIGSDISERKKFEQQLVRAADEWRTTFDSINDMIAIIDKDFRILRVNQAFADACQMKPQEVIGRRCYELVHGTDTPHPQCPHMRTLQNMQVCASDYFESRLGKYVEVTTSPIFGSTGVYMGVVHVMKDITARKQLEAEERVLREKAEVNSRLAAVGEMAAGIAHEINNPLTGVIGFSQMLLSEELPAEVQEQVKMIVSGGQRVSEIVKRMLTFARQTKPERTDVNLHDLLDNTVSLRGYLLKTANIEVIRKYAEELPALNVDAGQMQQVFLNLIINAEHAIKSSRGRGRIEIVTVKTEGCIRIEFRDDGPGIDENVQTRIFQPFFTTKEPGEGTGLGLSLSRSIVLEHGGNIWVESKIGEGSNFIVELPLSLAIRSESQIVAEPSSHPTGERAKTEARILVIDDEAAVRDVLKSMLKQLGHIVETAASGEEGMQLLHDNSYDVILLDMRMPGSSGMELYSQITQQMGYLAGKIIIVTGDILGSDIGEFLHKYNLPLLAKPFDLKALEEIINSVLNASQS